MLRVSLKAANVPTIKYVAIGTSSTAPAVTDHTLGAEVFRKAVTSYANGAAVGELLVTGFLAAGDAVGVNIQEVALFAGNSATATPNTGVLVGRGLYSHTKGSETINI